MNHSFVASQFDNTSCARCSRDEVSHTDNATCETCGIVDECEIVDDILMCGVCSVRHTDAQEIAKRNKEIHKTVKYDDRDPLEDIIKAMKIETEKALQDARLIDASIKTRDDFFNSRIVSIVSLKNSIDSDETIPNEEKNYKLAEFLKNRFTHLQSTLIPQRRTELEASISEQQAIHVYLNNLANNLRKEEREKLKIADISYKPEPPKTVKAPTVKKVKIDKDIVRKEAAALGISEFTLQMFCVAKNMSPQEAAAKIKENMDNLNKPE